MHKERGELRVLVSQNPGECEDLFTDMAYVYMSVFGNTPGVYEGAVALDGSTISLNNYMNRMTKTSHSYNTKNLIGLIQNIESLSDMQQEVDGYTPYYNSRNVVARFNDDLLPSDHSHPIVCYWSDHEYPVCGFATGVVLENKEVLYRLIHTIPYLTRNNPDILGQVKFFLSNASKLTFPVLFEHETAVIPERAGRENGSRWSELLTQLRNKALEIGARYSLGFTFRESKYYQNSVGRGDFVYDFTTNSTTAPMQFYVVDLMKEDR